MAKKSDLEALRNTGKPRDYREPGYAAQLHKVHAKENVIGKQDECLATLMHLAFNDNPNIVFYDADLGYRTAEKLDLKQAIKDNSLEFQVNDEALKQTFIEMGAKEGVGSKAGWSQLRLDFSNDTVLAKFSEFLFSIQAKTTTESHAQKVEKKYQEFLDARAYADEDLTDLAQQVSSRLGMDLKAATILAKRDLAQALDAIAPVGKTLGHG